MTDKLPLVGVSVANTDNGEEYYRVGFDDVTAVEWGTTRGLHCDLPTVRVYRRGKPWSEHPFHNVIGVYYEKE